MGTAAKISIAIEAQTATLQKGFAEAKGAINSFAGGMSGSVASGVMKAQVAMAAFKGGLSIAQGAIEEVVANMDRMANVGRLADSMGMDAQALQALGYAAKMTGASEDMLTESLKKMQINIALAGQGTGEAKAAIEQLHLSARALAGLAPEAQIQILADAFQEAGTQSDRAALAVKIFGEQGTALLPMLQAGSSGLQDWADKAAMAGLATDEMIARSQAAALATKQLSATWGAFKDTLSASIMPLIKLNFDILNSAFQALHDGWDWMSGVVDADPLAAVSASVQEAVRGADGAAKKMEADAAKALETMRKRGESVTESLRTPMEDYAASLVELNELVKAGGITWDTYGRGAAKAMKTLGNSLPKPQDYTTPGVGALARGSAAGFSGLQEQLRRDKDRARYEQQMLGWQARIVAAVQRNNTLTIAPVNL